jgi:hypothetical protein
LYDADNTKSVDVNSKNKATSLKKIILESIGLYRKANIILLKLVPSENSTEPATEWVPFDDKDYESPIKNWQGKTVAYRVFMELTVQIDGRGHSYRTTLKVDPKEIFEKSLRSKTHFWKVFMPVGNPKCIVKIVTKSDEIWLAPDMFPNTFADNAVEHNSAVILHEMKNMDFDADEGGEDEMEEPEDEVNEEEQGDEEEEQPNEEKKDSEHSQP